MTINSICLLALLLGLDLGAQSESCKCGRGPKFTADGPTENYPWIVEVNSKDVFDTKCLGVIISAKQVLIPYWCDTDGEFEVVIPGMGSQNVLPESSKKIGQVTAEGNLPFLDLYGYSLLTLPTPLKFNKHLMPICIKENVVTVEPVKYVISKEVDGPTLIRKALSTTLTGPSVDKSHTHIEEQAKTNSKRGNILVFSAGKLWFLEGLQVSKKVNDDTRHLYRILDEEVRSALDGACIKKTNLTFWKKISQKVLRF